MMNHVPLRMFVFGALALSTTACSAIIAGKLSNKPSTEDAGVVDTGLVDGNLHVDLGGEDDSGVASCADTADGTACELPSGVASVCIMNVCTASRCGDGTIDPRTEACDDGNTVTRDGCEPETCAFTCTVDSECTNYNDCDGTETCTVTQHTCDRGTPRAVGTSCMIDETRTGVCNAAHVCRPADCGNGSVNPSEQCDDGNTVEGDGCDNDCTFSCNTNAECDDSDVCNGTERCDITGSHRCLAGTPLVCTSGDLCHASSCDAANGGCIITLIDADGDGHAPRSSDGCGDDCDDAKANVYAGAPELCDGLDNDCNSIVDDGAPTWYVDCDGDGYSAGLTSGVTGCTMPLASATGCPAGSSSTWTSRRPVDALATDCWDANADVHPAQFAWFTSAAPGRPSTRDFDYNCNDSEELRYTRINGSPVCTDAFARCSGQAYWVATAAPACGGAGTFTSCAYDRSGTCIRVFDAHAVQACH